MSALIALRLPGLIAAAGNDRDLLDRFISDRDDFAFEALVRRHSRLVLGVCRRMLGDDHLAEDAFQAVFLVLARNPGAAARASSMGGWLYGVARRVALAARRQNQRRRRHDVLPRTACEPEQDRHDLLLMLDEELAGLPPGYRDPILACYVDEQTHDTAAKRLGWSVSTLRRRLDRGRELLKERLVRRGATFSGVVAAGLFPSLAQASASRDLIAATVRVSVSGSGSASVVALAGIGGSWLARVVIAVVLLTGGVAAGVGGLSPAPILNPPVASAEETMPILAPAPARKWATVVGRVVLADGLGVPAPVEIKRGDGFVKDPDAAFARGPLFFEDRLISPKTRGVKNVVVWLRPDDIDLKAEIPEEKICPTLAREAKGHDITVDGFQFQPRMTVARAGDTLRFLNADSVPHNVDYYGPMPTADQAFNVMLGAKQAYVHDRSLVANHRPNDFHCNIHPWMKGYVWAFDHPYAAVTNADGAFEIADAPVGNWRIVVWHEVAGYQGGMSGRAGERITIGQDSAEATLGMLQLSMLER